MRCALIGLGMVAGTHVGALKASQEVSLAGVYGRDPGRAAEFAARQDIWTVYKSLDDLLADDSLDFVIIATPPNQRLDIVKQAIAAGKPILMEKPIERSLAAATEIVELCEAAKLPLGIVLQHRARSASQSLKDRMIDGELGDIQHIDIRVPWWRPQTYYNAPGRGSYARDGGGVMLTQAFHTLDLALWMAGPVSACQAMMHRTDLHELEAEDWASALLRFESGAMGVLSATTAAFPGRAESICVQGTKGSALLSKGILKLTYFDGSDTMTGEPARTGSSDDPMAFPSAWHQSVIEDFAQSLANNTSPLTSGRNALAAHHLIDAMERASKSRGEVRL